MRFNAAAVHGFVVFARVVGVLLILGSLAVLGTWFASFGHRLLVWPSLHPSRAEAALGFMLSGIALLLAGASCPCARRGALALSATVLLLGIAAFVQHVFGDGLDRGWVDRLLAPWPGHPPWHMVRLAAVGMILLGIIGTTQALGRFGWLRDGSALLAIALAVIGTASWGLALAGEEVGLLQQLPAQTSITLLLATLGWLSAVPTRGMTAIAVADSPGGAMARRLILPSLLLPLLLAFLFKSIQSAFGIPESLMLSLGAVAPGALLAAMIFWVAHLLERSERARREIRTLRDAAATDALTGLANRRRFDQVLASSLQTPGPRPPVLLMLDLDKFKSFNDDFGHQAGD